MTSALSEAEFATGHSVSRETLCRLRELLGLLAVWNARINLVGRTTLDDPWRRHVLDSFQLCGLLPERPSRIADLGSGAGFPGLVLAAATAHHVDLIEADKRKAAFLRTAAVRMELANVTIHARRIENLALRPDIVTARAFAGLDELLQASRPFASQRTQYLLLKGRRVGSELTAAERHWQMTSTCIQSLADPEGVVLILNDVVPRNAQSKNLSGGGDR